MIHNGICVNVDTLWREHPQLRRLASDLTLAEQHAREELAKTLHEQLGQQLAGALLAAGALSARLIRRHASEAKEASYLLEMLVSANQELNGLIRQGPETSALYQGVRKKLDF